MMILRAALALMSLLVSVLSPCGQQEGEQVARASCDAVWGGREVAVGEQQGCAAPGSAAAVSAGGQM